MRFILFYILLIVAASILSALLSFEAVVIASLAFIITEQFAEEK